MNCHIKDDSYIKIIPKILTINKNLQQFSQSFEYYYNYSNRNF